MTMTAGMMDHLLHLDWLPRAAVASYCGCFMFRVGRLDDVLEVSGVELGILSEDGASLL